MPLISDLPIAAAADGVRIAVRLTPRAGAGRIDGIVRLADGSTALKIAVAAPPAEGRANDALLQLLAKRCRLPRGALSIVGGAASRTKLVHITGNPAALLPKLGALLAEAAQHRSGRGAR